MAIFCTIILTGCGAHTAGSKPSNAASPEREIQYAQYHDLFLAACTSERPRAAARAKRLDLRAHEIVRVADAHPDDMFDGGERPSVRLAEMAELAACAPKAAKTLEEGASAAAAMEN